MIVLSPLSLIGNGDIFTQDVVSDTNISVEDKSVEPDAPDNDIGKYIVTRWTFFRSQARSEMNS